MLAKETYKFLINLALSECPAGIADNSSYQKLELILHQFTQNIFSNLKVTLSFLSNAVWRTPGVNNCLFAPQIKGEQILILTLLGKSFWQPETLPKNISPTLFHKSPFRRTVLKKTLLFFTHLLLGTLFYKKYQTVIIVCNLKFLLSVSLFTQNEMGNLEFSSPFFLAAGL